MAAFAFRLQKVLEHRVRIEDEKKQSFVKARQDYLKEKDILEGLERRLIESLSDTTEKSTGIFTYIAKHNYIIFLEDRIKDQEKKLIVFEEKMEKKKAEFNESQKNRRVIDKLKENAHKEYILESDRVEQKQNDEFALYGYVRK